MGKHLQINTTLLVSAIALLSCNNAIQIQQKTFAGEGVKPIWETRLPGDAGIYNDGLVGLPEYDGQIFFHSTFSQNGNEEDNRIHSLNMSTGEINWTYPVQFDAKNPAFFWGTPYQNNNLMVVKMPKFENVRLNDDVFCLDLKSRQKIWDIAIPAEYSESTNRTVVGNAEKFYFVEESVSQSKIVQGNLDGKVEDVLILYDTPVDDVRITTELLLCNSGNNSFLCFGIMETNKKSENEFENFLILFDINSQRNFRKIPVPKTEDFSLVNIVESEGKIFYTCGRNCGCIDPISGKILWINHYDGPLNYITQGISVSENICFLWGDNRYAGLNAQTGSLVYSDLTECGNNTIFDGRSYLVGRDGNLYVIDLFTGDILNKIICPEMFSKDQTGFLTGCKPAFYDSKLFVYGNYHAYCYETDSIN